MTQAKNGDSAKVHYHGTLNDGTVFDSSRQREPLAFTVGEGQLIKGFDAAVVGMAVGETKTVTIAAEEAYGPYHKEMVLDVARSQLPADMDLEIGRQLQAQTEGGPPLVLTVVSFDDAQVTLDGNHPLAGKDLTFEIELVEVA